ncbi:hypothetical protein HID58_044126, partial [Brassica napus]
EFWPKMAQQGIDGILFWPDYTLMFITSESERTTVRVGRNLRERGVFRRRERGGLVERRLSADITKKYVPVSVTCLSTVCTSIYTSRECEGYCISKGYNNGECRALNLEKPVGPDYCCSYYVKR